MPICAHRDGVIGGVVATQYAISLVGEQNFGFEGLT
jgi:hypothetical protein